MISSMKSLNFTEIIKEVVSDSKDDLVDIQKKQMLRGEASDGSKIGKYKNKYYRRKKFNLNPLAGYGNVDLRLTGEFQRNIKVFFFSDSFFFESSDSKSIKLQEMYGEEIYGLNVKSDKIVAKDIIQPKANQKIQEHLSR